MFRQRLAEAIEASGVSRAALARDAQLDRSTLSQLLSGEGDRLPRADSVAAIAERLKVSLDWLLGLSGENRIAADIIHESIEITPSARAPQDEQLVRWYEEAMGYKIRYVPSTLPDLAMTDVVMGYEYKDFTTRSADLARAASEEKLAYIRMPETDIEICMPVQELKTFARGEGRWRGLATDARRAQIGHLCRLTDELYPSLRIYLFDGLSYFSVPMTIFGPLRVAVYMGQMFFVFNTTEHIRVLTRHFDTLIRAAVVQAPDATEFLSNLRDEVD